MNSTNNSTLARPASGPTTIVPAAPGWHVIQPILECDGTPIHELVKTPVIAWKVTTHTDRNGGTFETSAAITIEISD